MNPAAFVRFVEARHQVYVNRAAGKPKPWTKDTILQSYRFCNVYRELDTVTQWIRQEWSPLVGGNPDAWFWMVVARLVNHPASLARMGFDWEGEWKAANDFIFWDTLDTRGSNGEKAFGSAYIVSTNGHRMPKHTYLDALVLSPLWEGRNVYRPRKKDSLAIFHTRLMRANGLGSFMAAQVVADLKNTHGDLLETAPDWWTWAAPGPGSLRGLSRVLMGNLTKKKVSAITFRVEIACLQEVVNARFKALGWKPLCAQDVQNCLCEYDKYERVRLGQGKPRQRYAGT